MNIWDNYDIFEEDMQCNNEKFKTVLILSLIHI